MFLISSSNKTGLATELILKLLSLSLYPACGRASFEDEDVFADDGDLADDQDEIQAEDGNEEADGKTTDSFFTDLCAKKPGLSLEDCLKEMIKDNGGSIQDCAYFKGKNYIDCLKLIVGKGKSGSGEQINGKEKLDDEYDIGTS